MNPRERGFLLLTSHLGCPDRRVLTAAQLRTLARRVSAMERPLTDRELEAGDLLRLGYSRQMAARILGLLQEESLLEAYLHRGRSLGCVPVTRVSKDYPLILRHRLGLDAPGCLWARGELPELQYGGIALVGSRDLNPENHAFAQAVGRMAAQQGLPLISGNARGADRTAQDACLEAGGRVISVVADTLTGHSQRENLTYVSEDGFSEEFSAQRALSRNRVIHALGRIVFVAQCSLGTGGTWDGTTRNLRQGWSPVACFRDGSPACRELEQMGAYLVGLEDLQELGALMQHTNPITIPGWKEE